MGIPYPFCIGPSESDDLSSFLNPLLANATIRWSIDNSADVAKGGLLAGSSGLGGSFDKHDGPSWGCASPIGAV